MSTLNQSSSLNSCTKFPIPSRDNHVVDEIQSQPFDYSKRAQWLRAAVLGANDGLVSTASLMMGVGAVKHDVKAMILTGFAGLIAGACSMAIGEFVSVYSQLDIEMAHIKRSSDHRKELEEEERENYRTLFRRRRLPPWPFLRGQ
uniref:Vacuolar iron transporter n=1 Tax=Cucumis melo TaxID=3656 RepID=A0A9I9DV97_CUCME